MIYRSCIFIIIIAPPTPPVPQLTFPSFVPDKQSAFIHSNHHRSIIPSILIAPAYIQREEKRIEE